MSTTVALSEAERVREANQAWMKAERAQDLEGIMPYIAGKPVFHLPGAKAIRGHEAIREYYAGFLKFSDFEAAPDEILVAGSGDLAIDIGHFCHICQIENRRVRVDGKYLMVWQKAAGEWKCIAMSTTNDAPAQYAPAQ